MNIIDETPEGKNFYYLRPKGTITYTVDRTYNVPLIELNFDGWFENSDQTFLFHLKVEFLTLYFSL